MFNVIDLFCGAGGFSEGFKNEGFEILMGFDFDETKIQVYNKNFGKNKGIICDISKLSRKEIIEKIKYNEVDVIIGSPPCNYHSSATRHKRQDKFLDIDKTRGAYHFYRIVSIIKPKWFIMENITEFYNTMDIEMLKELFKIHGYTVTLQQLNAIHFGVPQNRRRGFLIGNILGRDIVIERHLTKDKDYITIREAIEDLEKIEFGTKVYLPEPTSEYQKMMRNKQGTTTEHICTNHNKKTINNIKLVREGKKKIDNYHIPSYDKFSPTITTRFEIPSGKGSSIHPTKNRSFTPREAARLQSFRDSFEFLGTRKDIREQIGHAVPPLLSQAIAKNIKFHLENE